jgi:hypothetical protein
VTNAERIRRLEKLLADYVMRYGATPEAKEYFADMSRANELSEPEEPGNKSRWSQ